MGYYALCAAVASFGPSLIYLYIKGSLKKSTSCGKVNVEVFQSQALIPAVASVWTLVL